LRNFCDLNVPYKNTETNIIDYTIKRAVCVEFFQKNNAISQKFSFSSHKEMSWGIIHQKLGTIFIDNDKTKEVSVCNM